MKEREFGGLRKGWGSGMEARSKQRYGMNLPCVGGENPKENEHNGGTV